MENNFKDTSPPRPVRAVRVEDGYEFEGELPDPELRIGTIKGLPGIDGLIVYDQVCWDLCIELLNCRGLPEKRARLRAMLDEMIG